MVADRAESDCAIAIALVVASAVMYVLHTYTDVFSEEKRKNRSSAKN